MLASRSECRTRLDVATPLKESSRLNLASSEKNLWNGKELAKKKKKGGHAGEGSEGRVEQTHRRTIFATM
jgi:hypothetical protein